MDYRHANNNVCDDGNFSNTTKCRTNTCSTEFTTMIFIYGIRYNLVRFYSLVKTLKAHNGNDARKQNIRFMVRNAIRVHLLGVDHQTNCIQFRQSHSVTAFSSCPLFVRRSAKLWHTKNCLRSWHLPLYHRTIFVIQLGKISNSIEFRCWTIVVGRVTMESTLWILQWCNGTIKMNWTKTKHSAQKKIRYNFNETMALRYKSLCARVPFDRRL